LSAESPALSAPAHNEILPALQPFQALSACCVGAGIDDASGFQA